jgi:hypothetical protein
VHTLKKSLLVLLIAASPAAAWNPTGHGMTAEIAYQQLTLSRQQQVIAVLRTHPRFEQDFAAAMPREIRVGSQEARDVWILRRASVWPDLVPDISDSVRQRYHRGTWHYINLPAYLAPQDQKLLQGKLEHNMSMQFEPPLRQDLNVVQALQGNLRVWQDEMSPDPDKAVALCWILHLTGDLHQPLHTVALFSVKNFPAGDRGGNSIGVMQTPRPSNLHAAWDNLPNNFSDLSPSMITLDTLANDSVSIDSPATWVRNHHRLAVEAVYTPELKAKLQERLERDDSAMVSLSEAYRTKAGAIAKEQVVLAGYRIAALLDL